MERTYTQEIIVWIDAAILVLCKSPTSAKEIEHTVLLHVADKVHGEYGHYIDPICVHAALCQHIIVNSQDKCQGSRNIHLYNAGSLLATRDILEERCFCLVKAILRCKQSVEHVKFENFCQTAVNLQWRRTFDFNVVPTYDCFGANVFEHASLLTGAQPQNEFHEEQFVCIHRVVQHIFAEWKRIFQFGGTIQELWFADLLRTIKSRVITLCRILHHI